MALLISLLTFIAGCCWGFLLGCMVGAKRGPAFCRGVVRGFFHPWECLTRGRGQ